MIALRNLDKFSSISWGTKYPRYLCHLNLVADFKKRGVTYEFQDMSADYEWHFWRCQLHDFMQKYFQPRL